MTDCQHCHKPIFQSTLSMRRATHDLLLLFFDGFISIHALHEESDINGEPVPASVEFQSTLSMRRATYVRGLTPPSCDFNPRSP